MLFLIDKKQKLLYYSYVIHLTIGIAWRYRYMATSSFDRNVTIDNSNYKSLEKMCDKKQDHITIDFSNTRSIKLISKDELRNLKK